MWLMLEKKKFIFYDMHNHRKKAYDFVAKSLLQSLKWSMNVFRDKIEWMNVWIPIWFIAFEFMRKRHYENNKLMWLSYMRFIFPFIWHFSLYHPFHLSSPYLWILQLWKYINTPPSQQRHKPHVFRRQKLLLR